MFYAWLNLWRQYCAWSWDMVRDKCVWESRNWKSEMMGGGLKQLSHEFSFEGLSTSEVYSLLKETNASRQRRCNTLSRFDPYHNFACRATVQNNRCVEAGSARQCYCIYVPVVCTLHTYIFLLWFSLFASTVLDTCIHTSDTIKSKMTELKIIMNIIK